MIKIMLRLSRSKFEISYFIKMLPKLLLRNPEHPYVFGGVIFLGTWISMMVSTVNGAGTPIIVRNDQRAQLVFLFRQNC